MLNSMSIAASILPAPVSEPARVVGAAAAEHHAATGCMVTMTINGPDAYHRRARLRAPFCCEHPSSLLKVDSLIVLNPPLPYCASTWRSPHSCLLRRRNDSIFDEPMARPSASRRLEDIDNVTEGWSTARADEDDSVDKGPADDATKMLLDSVLHRLLPAAIERMLPTGGSSGQQLSADACQVSAGSCFNAPTSSCMSILTSSSVVTVTAPG